MLLVHDRRSGLGFLVVEQMRFLVLAGKEQGRDDGDPDEREGHPVRMGERVRGLGQALVDAALPPICAAICGLCRAAIAG